MSEEAGCFLGLASFLIWIGNNDFYKHRAGDLAQICIVAILPLGIYLDLSWCMCYSLHIQESQNEFKQNNITKLNVARGEQVTATKELIDQIMQSQLGAFAHNFKRDYSPGGSKLKNLVNKANNPFILALGQEIVIYSTLMRSLDSSLGNRLESIARAIAEASYIVYDVVEGDVPKGIDQKISDLMNIYTSKRRRPQLSDLEKITATGETEHKIHKSDYHLVKKSDERQHFLLELKIGGDLDNKKARSEKQALLEQYAILKYSPQIRDDSIIKLYFATAYNFSGEEEIWSQERVKQFFGEEELLIGRDFWNFISDSDEGYRMVINAYLQWAPLLKKALEEIIEIARQNGSAPQMSLWEKGNEQ